MEEVESTKKKNTLSGEEIGEACECVSNYYDYLTESYDRRGFIYRTETYLKDVPDKTEYAVLFFNLKKFKAVNELIGTDGGDEILRTFARELQRSFLHPVYCARVEADHFVCLIERKNLDFQRLSVFCEHDCRINNRAMKIYCRCGIYYVDEGEAKVSQMIDRAKLAKEFIEDEYLKPFAIYDDRMKTYYIDRAKVSGEFEAAIANREFKVFFQPIVEIGTGKIVSAEALVRWLKPDGKLVTPNVFIPALERDGFISRLDQYVLQDVSSCMKSRFEHGQHTVPVSVNLSWMDFYDTNLMDDILEVTKDECHCLKAIRYEVTETSYAALEENHGSMMEKIQKHGAKMLLDDFGSGYSSLKILQDYDFDILKLDMSVTKKIATNEKAGKIAKSVIQMSHLLEIKVVAEGVETEEQLNFLKGIDCDYIQGYYFYKPMPEEEFLALLDKMDGTCAV